MKLLLSTLLFLLIMHAASAQVQRSVRYWVDSQDSVTMAFNNDYYLIEDTCATIIRYAHFNRTTHKFFGHFKDVNKQNPSQLLAEGNYTADGLKEGEFIAYNTNGTLRSKGGYKNNKYDGKWQVNDSSGKPLISFIADTDKVQIIEAWNDKGVKTIDNGNGNYEGHSAAITWGGKLVNGLPDGLWTAKAANDENNTFTIFEHFKKGKFIKGKNRFKEYDGFSVITLIDPKLTTYAYAELLLISPTSCGETGFKSAVRKIKSAGYESGAENFGESVKDLINPYFSKIEIQPYWDNDVIFICTIGETGRIIDVKCTSMFDDGVVRNLTVLLRRLPTFKPATIDDKPVTQDFRIVFNFHQGLYHFSYGLMPVHTK